MQTRVTQKNFFFNFKLYRDLLQACNGLYAISLTAPACTFGKGAVMRCMIGTFLDLKGKWSSDMPAAMNRFYK